MVPSCHLNPLHSLPNCSQSQVFPSWTPHPQQHSFAHAVPGVDNLHAPSLLWHRWYRWRCHHLIAAHQMCDPASLCRSSFHLFPPCRAPHTPQSSQAELEDTSQPLCLCTRFSTQAGLSHPCLFRPTHLSFLPKLLGSFLTIRPQFRDASATLFTSFCFIFSWVASLSPLLTLFVSLRGGSCFPHVWIVSSHSRNNLRALSQMSFSCGFSWKSHERWPSQGEP